MQGQTIPPGFCQCGCGGRTGIAAQTHRPRGWVKGQPQRFLTGHGSRTRNVPACGYVVEDRGYVTPCWIWGLGRSKAGYGSIQRHGKSMAAHIALWTDRNGPVPEGLELDHLCRIRACVNPDHLEPVTHVENVRRGLNAKLTADDVRMIRASPRTNKALAEELGVGRPQVSAVRSGRAWRDLP